MRINAKWLPLFAFARRYTLKWELTLEERYNEVAFGEVVIELYFRTTNT
jgi:hypothetical protein